MTGDSLRRGPSGRDLEEKPAFSRAAGRVCRQRNSKEVLKVSRQGVVHVRCP